MSGSSTALRAALRRSAGKRDLTLARLFVRRVRRLREPLRRRFERRRALRLPRRRRTLLRPLFLGRITAGIEPVAPLIPLSAMAPQHP